MDNIYEIKALFEDIGQTIEKFRSENNCTEKFEKELINLSEQCSQSAYKIIRDHSGEGIALENCRILLRQFNTLALKYKKS